MLVTYRMPICASAPASGLRSEHSNPLRLALAGPDGSRRSDELEILSRSLVIPPGELRQEGG